MLQHWLLVRGSAGRLLPDDVDAASLRPIPGQAVEPQACSRAASGRQSYIPLTPAQFEAIAAAAR